MIKSRKEQLKEKFNRRKARHILINPANADGERWIENAGTAWRFRGYADELARIDHRGWYIDDFQSDTFRGVVYQLPTHNGDPVYFIGYADPHNDDCVLGEVRTDLDDDTDAAYAADGFAEHKAEKAREYDEIWRAGLRYADARETIEQERNTRRSLIRELRAIRTQLTGDTPNLCKAIRDRIAQSKLASIEAHEIIKDVTNYVPSYLIDAFADGADLTIAEAKAIL